MIITDHTLVGGMCFFSLITFSHVRDNDPQGLSHISSGGRRQSEENQVIAFTETRMISFKLSRIFLLVYN